MHIVSGNLKVPYGWGPGLPKGPGSSLSFDALSCYLSHIFKHSDTKCDKKHSQSTLRKGGGVHACCAPSRSATDKPHNN